MNLAKLKRFIVFFTVTAAGSGMTPRAPGTAGSVMGMLLVYVVRGWMPLEKWVVFVALFLLGWWASLEYSHATQKKDNQQIVIDEVLGLWLTVLLLDQFAPTAFDFNVRLGLSFLAFRLFDVLKPFPIRQLDRWGKNFEIGPLQSAMITIDDLLASVYAAASIALLAAAFARF